MEETEEREEEPKASETEEQNKDWKSQNQNRENCAMPLIDHINLFTFLISSCEL